MYRLLVWTSKGGTGKTTTVANTGAELARLGHHVLMVGFDPQGDLEATFGIESGGDDGPTDLGALLAGEGDARSAPIEIAVPAVPGRIRRRGNSKAPGSLRLLASSPRLNEHTVSLAERGYRDLDGVLGQLDADADFALIDTQGALTPISQTAAWAADGVLFTGEPGYYEARALVARLAELNQLHSEGLHLDTVGLLFVRTDQRSRQMREYREHFADPENFPDPLYVFRSHTRQQASVREHPAFQEPTVIAEPHSHVAEDYRQFAQELTERLASLKKTT
jgi:cellulose biosynthesis protein BcsQ